MSGFANPIIGGGGSLVYPSIHSPNYVAGVSGWTINKDGSVEFNNGTFRGKIVGGQLFIYNGAPAAGNLIGSISGSSGTDSFGNAYVKGVTAYVKITTGSFQGTYAITLGDQAYAGPANFAALSFQNETSTANIIPALLSQSSTAGAELTLYSGRGTAGANAAELDVWDSLGAVGRTLAGIAGSLISLNAGGEIDLNAIAVATNGYHVLGNQGSTPAGISGNALLWADASGYLRFKPDSATSDTNVYELGAAHLFAKNVSQSITSTTPAVITGLSCVVGVGTYRVRAQLICTQGGTGAVQKFGFTGPTISDSRLNAYSLANGASVGASSTTTLSGSGLTTGVAFGPGATWISDINGWITFTAAGTLALNAAEGTNLDTFTVVDGTMDVEPAI